MLGNYRPATEVIKKSFHFLIGSSFFFSVKIFTWINICTVYPCIGGNDSLVGMLYPCRYSNWQQCGDFLLVLSLNDVGFCVQYVEPFL